MICRRSAHDHLAAQQHFAADDDRRDRAGMILRPARPRCRRGGRSSRDRVRSRRRAEPSTRPWTQARAPCRARCRWNRCGCIWIPWQVRARSSAICSGLTISAWIMRRLIVPERRVGNALQLRRAIDRRARQRHRRGQPPPHRGNDAQRYEEKRQRRAKADRPAPKSGEYVAYLAAARQPCRPADAAVAQLRRRHGSGDIRPASSKKHQE